MVKYFLELTCKYERVSFAQPDKLDRKPAIPTAGSSVVP